MITYSELKEIYKQEKTSPALTNLKDDFNEEVNKLIKEVSDINVNHSIVIEELKQKIDDIRKDKKKRITIISYFAKNNLLITEEIVKHLMTYQNEIEEADKIVRYALSNNIFFVNSSCLSSFIIKKESKCRDSLVGKKVILLRDEIIELCGTGRGIVTEDNDRLVGIEITWENSSKLERIPEYLEKYLSHTTWHEEEEIGNTFMVID